MEFVFSTKGKIKAILGYILFYGTIILFGLWIGYIPVLRFVKWGIILWAIYSSVNGILYVATSFVLTYI